MKRQSFSYFFHVFYLQQKDNDGKITVTSHLSSYFARHLGYTLRQKHFGSLRLNTYKRERQNNITLITNATRSSYKIVTNSEDITKGNFIHILVTARDSEGNIMPNGGDYFIAEMYNYGGKEWYSTTGRIFDYDNGTYSIYFYASWSGTAKISIVLVHPSIAAQFLRTTWWNMGPRLYWIGTFNHTNVTHPIQNPPKTLCAIVSKHSIDFECKYGAKSQALGNYTFACKRLQDVRCELKTMRVAGSETIQRTRELAKDYLQYFGQ